MPPAFIAQSIVVTSTSLFITPENVAENGRQIFYLMSAWNKRGIAGIIAYSGGSAVNSNITCYGILSADITVTFVDGRIRLTCNVGAWDNVLVVSTNSFTLATT